MKKFISLLIFLVVGAGAGIGGYVWYASPGAEPGSFRTAEAEADFCERHQLPEADCPWCTPGLVEELGMCPGHGVPEAFCSRCNPKLIPGFKAENDWCAGHEVPESQCTACGAPAATDEGAFCEGHQIAEAECPWCDPSLIEELGMCPGHGVPEALCSRCNPKLIPGFKAENDWCAGHDVPESQCIPCHPELATATDEKAQETGKPRVLKSPSVTCATESLRIQFESPDIASEAGLEYAKAEKRELSETLTCNAEVAYDGNRYAHLSSRAPGIVEEVTGDLGDRVAKGDVLAVVDSTALGAARAEFLQAQALVRLWEKNHAREKKLVSEGIGTQRELLEAETSLTEARIARSRARQRLCNLGLTDEQIEGLKESREPSSLLPARAPFDGVVVERAAVVGEVVDTKSPLFAIADTSRMWALLDIYEKDLPKLRVGQRVVLRLSGLRGRPHGGTLTWISAHVDRKTRTLKARVELANPDGLLRDGMFGTAEVTVRDREAALVVPKAALQWEGCCNVVFVRKSETLFLPRKVQVAYEAGDHIVLASGVAEGETVVTTGSFLLKTELLKGNIGAGCCEVNPGQE